MTLEQKLVMELQRLWGLYVSASTQSEARMYREQALVLHRQIKKQQASTETVNLGRKV